MSEKVSTDQRFKLLDAEQQPCDYSGKEPETAALRSGIYSPAELEALAKLIREGRAKGEITSSIFGLVSTWSLLEFIASLATESSALALVA